MLTYFQPANDTAAHRMCFCAALTQYMKKPLRQNRDIVILCIGTPLLFADSFGPMTGSLLAQRLKQSRRSHLFLYGTLERPVHALNYETILLHIRRSHRRAFILAIDASLGRQSHIGLLTLQKGRLYPGSGMPKKPFGNPTAKRRPLSPVGKLSVTGIVQDAAKPVFCCSDLPPVNLPVLYKMASFLADGITDVLL